MFSLVSGVYHWLFSRPEVCVLLVGLQGSGKTTFFEQLKERYARSGSKAAGGTAVRAPVGNRRQAILQNGQANRQHHDRLQQDQPPQGKRHQGRQQQTTQQDTQPNDKQQENSQQDKYEQRDLQPYHRQQQVARGLEIVEPLRTRGTQREACPLPQVSSTTGLNFCRFRYQDVDVILWDLAGLTSFHAIWVDYFQNAHCVLYFVDSTSSVEGMEKSRAALNSLVSAAMTVLRKKASEKKQNVCLPPLLIVATKQDLAGARVPPAGTVRAVFSCEREYCCSTTSGGGQRTQQPFYDDRCPVNGCPHHRFQLNAVFSHSARSWDSVEELLRRAVRAAKAYYELLSLPLHEINPASTQDACGPSEKASCKLTPRRRSGDSAELHVSVASEAAPVKKHTLLENSRPRPVHSSRRCVVRGESAQFAPRRTQIQNTTACAGGKLSGSQPVDCEAESEVLTNLPEVPCWHYATMLGASGASFVAADPVYAPSLKGSDGAASQLQSWLRNDAATATAGVGFPTTAAYDSSDTSVPFQIAATRQIYQANGAWSTASARDTELKRESSGLYELGDCM